MPSKELQIVGTDSWSVVTVSALSQTLHRRPRYPERSPPSDDATWGSLPVCAPAGSPSAFLRGLCGRRAPRPCSTANHRLGSSTESANSVRGTVRVVNASGRRGPERSPLTVGTVCATERETSKVRKTSAYVAGVAATPRPPQSPSRPPLASVANNAGATPKPTSMTIIGMRSRIKRSSARADFQNTN